MADTTLPPLPPGFELEGDPVTAPVDPAGAAPPLPPGFVLEEEPALEIDIVGGTPGAAPTPQEMSSLRSGEGGLGRDIAMGARSVLQGAGGLVGALGGDAFNHYVVPGEQPSYREAAAGLADKLGLPRAESAQERVMGDVGEALTGTGLTMGAGGLLNVGRNVLSTVAPTARNALADLLTTQPKLQVLSTATGAGAASTTREAGGGEGAQLAAGLAGGLGPGLASALSGAAARGLVRGRSGADMQGTINDFAALGASPSVGQASGNRFVQGVENLLGGAPTSAGVINRFAERQADEIGAGLQKNADDFYRNASGERAGRAILRGVHGPDGFTKEYKATQAQLFDRLDNFIPAQKPIGISNTTAALGQLNAPIPGAPNVSKFFQNSKIKGVEDALERDLSIPTDAKNTLDEALSKIDSLYASRDNAVQDMGKFSAFANDQVNRTGKFYPVQGAPRFPGRYSEFPQRAAEAAEAAGEAGTAAMGNVSRARQIEGTLEQLQSAVAATDGRLPYEAIKKLRTLVGQEIDNAGLMSDFPRDKWKALYGALSDDLRTAAGEAGPDATQAFNRANTYTRAGMDRVETLSGVIDKNGGPEKIFNAVMSGTRDGGSTLRAVMQSLPPEGQKAVTAAVIKRMGLATPGAQDAAGEAFSAQTFLTNWNKVSDEAKRALFDRHGAGFSRDMDRIASVAQNIRDGSKVLSNPSGTANRAAALTYGGSLALSMLDPSFVSTGSLVAGGAIANAMARALTNPKAVKFLARSTAVPMGSTVAQANALRAIGEKEEEPDLVLLADALLEKDRVNNQASADQ